MPTYALLGATGSTGGAVLQALLNEPIRDLELRILVRSKSKLLKSYPNLETNASFRITIIEANLDGSAAVQRCLDGAELIYCCIATNDSAPGISVTQEAARSVLTALRGLKAKQGAAYTSPTLLINRSITLNEEAEKKAGFGKTVVHFLLFYCYDDIAKAVELYRAASKTERLLELICVDPPALHAGTKYAGHTLSLTEEGFRSLNYSDLGASFVEIGKRKQEFSGKAVMVSAAAPEKVEEHWDVLQGYLLRGLRGRILGY